MRSVIPQKLDFQSSQSTLTSETPKSEFQVVKSKKSRFNQHYQHCMKMVLYAVY